MDHCRHSQAVREATLDPPESLPRDIVMNQPKLPKPAVREQDHVALSSALLNTATLKHRKTDVGVFRFMATEPIILIPRQTHRPARDLLECTQRAAIWTRLTDENLCLKAVIETAKYNRLSWQLA